MQDNHYRVIPNCLKALMLAQRRLSKVVYATANLEVINITSVDKCIHA